MAPVGLICFHHAGGGSTSFHALRHALTDLGADVTLQVATLPGAFPIPFAGLGIGDVTAIARAAAAATSQGSGIR